MALDIQYDKNDIMGMLIDLRSVVGEEIQSKKSPLEKHQQRRKQRHKQRRKQRRSSLYLRASRLI